MNRTMNNPVAAADNFYFEMETQNATNAGDVVAPGAKQLTLEKQGAERNRRVSTELAHSWCKSDSVIVQRLLCMMTAVIIIFCVLIAAATLVLALAIMSRNTSATDCTVVQGKRNQTLNLIHMHTLRPFLLRVHFIVLN